MEKELILCDTDVMVEFFKKNIQVLQLMNDLGPENLFMSLITQSELQQGAQNKVQ